MRSGIACAILCLLAAGCACRDQVGDCVYFHDRPASDAEVGIVLDGQTPGGAVIADRIILTKQSVRNVGKVTAGPQSSDLVCFCRGRPPVYLKKPVGDTGSRKLWTDDKDESHVRFMKIDPLPVFVWVVREDGMDDAEAAVKVTNSIFEAERMGIQLAATITDVSSYTNAGDFREWRNSDHHDKVKSATVGIKHPDTGELAYTPERLNIYLVEDVDGQPRAGHTDLSARDTIALGESSSSHLLAHEVGHACYLDHPNGFEADVRIKFNDCNIMWTPSVDRTAITEGQVFMAHFAADSALNKLYELRDGSAENPTFIWYQFLEGPEESKVPIWLRLWKEPRCFVKLPPQDLVKPEAVMEPRKIPSAPLARMWAATDCTVGPRHAALRAEILRRGARMEGALAGVFAGPGDAVLDQVAAAAARTYRLLGRHALSNAEYVKREKRRYLDGWRATVIESLGDVGTRDSLSLLRPLAAHGDGTTNQGRAARAIAKILRRHPG